MTIEAPPAAAPQAPVSIPASTSDSGAAAAVSAGKSGTAVVSASGQPTSNFAKSRIAAFDRLSNNDGGDDNTSHEGELSVDDIDNDAPTATEIDLPESRNVDNRRDVSLDVEEQYAAQQRREAAKQKKLATTASPITTPQPVVEPARDYSAFLPEDAEIMKKMPNHIYDAFKERAIAAKQLNEEHNALKAEVDRMRSGALPESYYQHPHAISLMPEYRAAQETIEQADFEAGVYENAIAAIDSGVPYKIVTGYDNASGQPIYRTIQPPVDAEGNPMIDNVTKAKITRALQATLTARQSALGNANALQQNFQQRHQQMVQQFAQAQAQTFPVYERLEFKPQIAAAVQQLPAYLRTDPNIAGFAARGLMLVRALQQKVNELTAESQRNATMLSDRTAAGPAAALLAAANGGVAPDPRSVLNMGDFED